MISAIILGGAALVLLGERIWKHWMVVRFFRRPVPAGDNVALVSIVQPILSGDPTMPACLEQSLRARSRFAREFVWLVDDDDRLAQQICRDLINRYPDYAINLMLMPPPGPRENPKMIKLLAGMQQARGDVLCVLDDDTQLPDGGLERCLPFLDQPGVGLAFGLPYYTSFGTLWSRMVAYFVNSHSLLTYVPYTMISEPMTINGMFYALRRTTYAAIGGFAGLEHTLADDFAVARRVREHGLRLAQTPLCHAISTTVTGPRHYLSLIQRWFIFPRESLLRHLRGRDLLVLYALAMLPAFAPWLALGALVAWPSAWTVGFALLYVGYDYAIFAHFNQKYLQHAAPWRYSWLVPLLQLTFPLQLLAALLLPQRITWRGHELQVERGGTFRFVRRRSE
jgi:ceramide glucosyltransferase